MTASPLPAAPIPAPPLAAPPLPAYGKKAHWHVLPGLASAAALLDALQKERRMALVVTANSNDTQEWQAALEFLAGDDSDFLLSVFPDQETLPYDHFSPHPDITSDRLRALYHIQQEPAPEQYGVYLVSATTLLMRLCPRSYINRDTLLVNPGQSIDVDQLKRQLDNCGYQHRETVFQHGEYAVRGSLLDVFPMGSHYPYRIELFDDEVESIRTFDPESQRSLDRIENITILPASEVAMDAEAINLFRDNWHLEFRNDPEHCPVYGDTIAGISSAGIESYLPMFYSETETLFDYLPDNTLVVAPTNLQTVLDHFLNDVKDRFDSQSIDPTRPLLAPAKLYLAADECQAAIKRVAHIQLRGINGDTDPVTPVPVTDNPARGEHRFNACANPYLLIDAHAESAMHRIEMFLQGENGTSGRAMHTLFCVESLGRREVFAEKLKAGGIEAQTVDSWSAFRQDIKANGSDQPVVAIAVAAFNEGALFPSDNIAIIAEPELFGVSIKPRARGQRERERGANPEAAIHNLIELRIGAPIVHVDHGVGRYLGLEHLALDDFEAEFMALEYAGGDKLYVPVTSLHLINRYMGGDEVTAPMNKLGSEQWAQAKKKAVANVRDVAAELLNLYAKRQSAQAFAFTLPQTEYQQFADEFPFEETVDQLTAIDAVAADMQSDKPMDRLICGDVGFGKTEVAMRAAFIAAQNSKQVMVLVPTTLLAQQHTQNFVDRFADWPITVDSLSRFRTGKEQSRVLESFANGKIDILIGTHKLLQKDIKAKDLGLVIVDEEHRFGVRQKEQLKTLCTSVDLLTMTATPIPRTLNMAMAGIRDLSIIATPPARRLSVKTFVNEKQTSLLKEALLRELLRGGQVFYLHNDVDSIERAAREISELVPDARVAIGHGQMRERELEQVMSDFYHKKHNVLVCTTIIETGIDIPNANTIIIDRADKFGLAQLHQLRGRVGRSHHQAYAYLFVPNRKLLARDAEKRLEAIEESQDLGAGFILATHDLEIRGAGELLGAEQSGQMQSIGFSLYLDMLERAVNALKAGDDVKLEDPLGVIGEINLHLPALIPDEYLPDVHNRLLLYKRIANAESAGDLRELQVEMIDRFGLLTPEIRNLFAITAIKLDCVALGIEKIDAGVKGGYIEFCSNTVVDPMTIVTMVQQEPHCYRLSGATRLTFNVDLEEPDQRLQWVASLVQQFLPETTGKH